MEVGAMTYQTQSEAILAHLKKGHSITALQSLRLCGCMRLSARIYGLRQDGHNIKSRFVSRGTKTVSEYWLSKPWTMDLRR